MNASLDMTVEQAFAVSAYSWPKQMLQGLEPEHVVTALSDYFHGLTLAQIGLAEIEAYQTDSRHKRRHSGVINTECAALLGLLASAKLLTPEIEDGYTPFQSVTDISPIYDGVNSSGLNDLEPLFSRDPASVIDGRIQNCCAVILGTAVLWEELRLMRQKHVDLEGRTITVPAYRCVPERTMPIKHSDRFPDPVKALRSLMLRARDMGADTPDDYLLPFDKTRRAYPLKKLWAALMQSAKLSNNWFHEKLRYSLRAWALQRWPELAATAGPGPDEDCGGLADICANMNNGWRAYYPMPGTVTARMPHTYNTDDSNNLFFDEATQKKARDWNAMFTNKSVPPPPSPQKTRPVDHPVRTKTATEPPAPTHSNPTAGKVYEGAKKASSSIGDGMVSVKDLIGRLKKAGISAEKILEIISEEETG